MARVKNNKAGEMAAGARAAKQELIAAARPVGRPSLRTPDIEHELFVRLADGEDLVSITCDTHMPGRSTVAGWMESDPEFRAKIQAAYQAQAIFMVGMGMSVIDGGQHSTGNVERDKAKLSYIKWLMGKFDRAWFGEHMKVDHAVEQTVINLPAEFGGLLGNPVDAEFQPIDPSKEQ